MWSPQCTGFTRTIVMQKAAPAGYAMKMQRLVRFGALKHADALKSCDECVVAEQRTAVVRPNGNVELGAPEESAWVRPMGCGRSPGWDIDLATARPRSAAEYLARAAHLEAASVAAFARIAEELEALGAPYELVARANRAAAEEAGHATAIGELARAHGAEPPPFVPRDYALRDALALARDNAIEGRVNETFGALLLHVQALTADDVASRAAFAQIAADEASHAELSRDIGTWLEQRLSPAERSSVSRAASQARSALATSLGCPLLDDEHDRRRLGLPDPATARRLLAELERRS